MSQNDQNDKPAPNQIQFFRNAVSGHDKVHAVEAISEQLYGITRVANLSDLRVYLTDLYTVGCADVIEIASNHEVDCIVVMSKWSGYTGDAKRYASERHIGLFMFQEFMGALNYRFPWKYEK